MNYFIRINVFAGSMYNDFFISVTKETFDLFVSDMKSKGYDLEITQSNDPNSSNLYWVYDPNYDIANHLHDRIITTNRFLVGYSCQEDKEGLDEKGEIL